MKIASNSTNRKAQVQRIGMALAPPTVIGLCLLANLDLASIALITMAVAFPASLYNRRLSASMDNSSSYGYEEDTAKVFEDKQNMVVYKTAEGPQIIALYKIIRRPHSYSFDKLKASFSNANLTIYPIIHTNGPFLAIRFSSDSKKEEKERFWDISKHLNAFARALMRKIPDLELTPASLADVKALMGVFGLKVRETESSAFKALKSPNTPNLKLGESVAQDICSVEDIQKELSQKSETSFIETERAPSRLSRDLSHSVSQTNIASTNKEKPCSYFSERERYSKINKDALALITKYYQDIIATIESAQDDPNTAPITATGKRIAGQLVIKDLKAILEVLQNQEGFPVDLQDKIAAVMVYFELHFGNRANYDECWDNIPDAVELVERVLEELLLDHEPNFRRINVSSGPSGF